MQLLLLSNLSPGRRAPPFSCHLPAGFEDIASIAHNKVLVAAVVSTAVGQLSKPFTSAFLYGNSFDFKAVVQSGGFPSTHSSAVVATATSLGLERGFSDSIFGLTVVYAALVMYDAQGVRREVGKHARIINKVLLESTALKAEEESTTGKQVDSVQDLENASKLSFYLYERVGHTELEVFAGCPLVCQSFVLAISSSTQVAHLTLAGESLKGNFTSTRVELRPRFGADRLSPKSTPFG